MNLPQILDRFGNDPKLAANIAHWHTVSAEAARWADFPGWLDPRLIAVLERRGITRLYSHQRDAVDAANAGRNVVVVTPTASGKTLCYNLPVLNTMIDNPGARALYLFPTKALSQDQRSEIVDVIETAAIDVKAHTFDGDTPSIARKAVRTAGNVVITNPDMLHTGILPHHTRWVKLFENLRWVVIDELHMYRGVFGSHLGNVIRRLKRLCKFYGSNPQFITCSATIRNPVELAENVIDADFTLVDNNGAPRGAKHVILYNPPIVNPTLGIRRSGLIESRNFAAEFLGAGISTIVFTPMRRQVEVLLTYLRETMKKRRMNPQSVVGYRGGYLPKERRTIEHGLRDGSLKGVISTNALELGIDIGSLEVAVLNGYPGSIASLWQQIGRAGRKSDVSAAIVVGNSSPVNQFLMRHPEFLFERSPESGIVDPDNLIVLTSHLKCAVFELPMASDTPFGPGATGDILEYLASHNVIHRAKDDKFHWMSEIYPAQQVSLRSASPENFVIYDSAHDRTVGEIDYFAAPEFVHPKAIYLHGADQYQVEELDWEGRRATVIPVDVDYYTDAETKVDLKVLEHEREHLADAVMIGEGEVSLTRVAVQYKKIKFFTHENVGFGPIDLPEQEMHTTAFWLEFDENFHELIDIPPAERGSVLRAAANALEKIVPIWVMADIRDIGAVSQVRARQTDRPTIYLYDNIPGGVGFARKIFDMAAEICQQSAAMIADCDCRSGCPACTGPEAEIGPHGKPAAAALLRLAADTLTADPYLAEPDAVAETATEFEA